MKTAVICDCGGDSTVEETRPAPAGRIRRRRKCTKCGATWRTYEERSDRPSFLEGVAKHLDQVRGDAVALALRAVAAS